MNLFVLIAIVFSGTSWAESAHDVSKKGRKPARPSPSDKMQVDDPATLRELGTALQSFDQMGKPRPTGEQSNNTAEPFLYFPQETKKQ